jgi:hypothetical protein
MIQNRQVALKALLIGFGILLGLATLAVSLEIYGRVTARLNRGSSFSSLSELRSEMISDDKNPGGKSLSLRALIYPNPDDRIIYELRPNLDAIFQKVRVLTNSCGMRSKEIAVKKSPGVYRIALLGDSFAFGWGVNQEKIFAHVLEDTLNRSGAGKTKFEVLNFGVPGYSTFQEVYRFLESGADFDPDAILVYFINNDFGYPFYVRDAARPGGMLSGMEFARIAMKALDPEVEDQKLLMNGLDPNSSIRALSDFAREKGIRLSVAINPYKKWEKDQKRVPILNQRRDIELIDMKDPLMNSIEARAIPLPDLQLPDDPHPSAIKHKLFGEILASYYLGVAQ